MKNKTIFYKISSFALVLLFSGMFTPLISQSIPAGSIENISAIETRKGVVINYAVQSEYDFSDLEIIIKYIPQNDFVLKGTIDWNFKRKELDESGQLIMKSLLSETNYYYSLALMHKSDSTDINEIEAWSGLHVLENDERWSLSSGLVLHLLSLFGALGLFIYGMKLLSEGTQKGTGKFLRKLIGNMSSTSSIGIFNGFLTTAIVQSSSAITVLVVSFVNTGILTLKQGFSVIIGANIGTTITAWIIAYFGFLTFASEYSLVLFLIAIILLFSGKTKYIPFGEALVGFSLLFIGFEFLKMGVPDVRSAIEQFEFLETISGTSAWNVLLAIIIGMTLTIILQSSIAALVIIMLLTARGIIPYEMSLGMVGGSNIGTTITANIAAITGNVHAKRVARAHLMYNLIGILWLVPAFPYVVVLIDQLSVRLFGLTGGPSSHLGYRPMAMAFLQTPFNIINSFLVFYFMDTITKWLIRIVPSKNEEDEMFQFGYIKAGVLSTPELSIIEAKKEIAKYARITSRMSEFTQNILIESNKKQKIYLYGKIEKYESITDRVEIELSNYLTLTAKDVISEETSNKVRGMLAVTSYLERIGDVFYQMSINLQRKDKERIWFSPEQRENLIRMLKHIDEAFQIMIHNLSVESSKIAYQKAKEKENQINRLRDDLRKMHFENVEKQEYNLKSGIIYSDLFFSCEKIGDHIFSITEAIIGEEKVENMQKKELSENS
ncbi:MAG: Na/Pi cotransporter family protein [Crocinitomicaceae bacterium]|nr:Na/Pi cotransporter family protein [Crocinitomicaceae bacterium]